MAVRKVLQPATNLLLRPFQFFFAHEAAGSILLLLCTGGALVWANSPVAESYHRLWATYIGFGVGDFEIRMSLHHWINDGLMAIFFFVIGLEIKREVLVGELATMRRAALPLFAAVGGMVVPALLYAVFNAGTPEIAGWGVPMATDIAFALGVLSLIGPSVPIGLKVFLAALAIVDDLGAVLVIAIFYTAEVSLVALGVGGVFLAAMFLANRMAVRYPLIYAALGFGLWVALLQSGVHGTVAGVLGAMAIPAWRRIDGLEFAGRARLLLGTFERDIDPDIDRLTMDQIDAVAALEVACEAVETPLSRLEHTLLPWVAFFIMPVFALSNAGVDIGAGFLDALVGPVSLGIMAGLFAGKQVGVALFAWVAVRMGMAELPAGATWKQLYGVACLCGIGFTMSLFIANLAFPQPETLDVAKAGILVASLASGVLGYVLLRPSKSQA
ncbi:MAG TPA: Na+/H+ antiporter NhaA [Longimicrobiales bacterium]|nr:Na+/H+ antiporter NhaA [Longimicrobiales bacterium]